MGGARAMGLCREILLPLSGTHIAALFVNLFIYGWNQYLWPLLVASDQSYYTIVMGIQRMARAADDTPLWHLVMATTILALLPPVLVVIAMQRLFVKGLVETEHLWRQGGLCRPPPPNPDLSRRHCSHP